MRPLSLIVFAACVGTIIWSLFAGAICPWVSALIYLLSAALIVVDFNYLRKHGTEDDAIWLATGIFVSIVNIFISLLNIFSRGRPTMESSLGRDIRPRRSSKARKAAELRGAPFLVYRDDKGSSSIVALDERPAR